MTRVITPAARPPIQRFDELPRHQLERLAADPRMGAVARERIAARLLELGATQAPASTEAAQPKRPAAHRTGVMNQTEAAFLAEVLGPRGSEGVSVRVMFERIQFWLAERLTYRPDYIEVLPCGGWWVWEVKGGHIQEDARVKFKAAGEAYPWMRWTMVQRKAQGQPWTMLYDRGTTQLGLWPTRIRRPS